MNIFKSKQRKYYTKKNVSDSDDNNDLSPTQIGIKNQQLLMQKSNNASAVIDDDDEKSIDLLVVNTKKSLSSVLMGGSIRSLTLSSSNNKIIQHNYSNHSNNEFSVEPDDPCCNIEETVGFYVDEPDFTLSEIRHDYYDDFQDDFDRSQTLSFNIEDEEVNNSSNIWNANNKYYEVYEEDDNGSSSSDNGNGDFESWKNQIFVVHKDCDASRNKPSPLFSLSGSDTDVDSISSFETFGTDWESIKSSTNCTASTFCAANHMKNSKLNMNNEWASNSTKTFDPNWKKTKGSSRNISNIRNHKSFSCLDTSGIDDFNPFDNDNDEGNLNVPDVINSRGDRHREKQNKNKDNNHDDIFAAPPLEINCNEKNSALLLLSPTTTKTKPVTTNNRLNLKRRSLNQNSKFGDSITSLTFEEDNIYNHNNNSNNNASWSIAETMTSKTASTTLPEEEDMEKHRKKEKKYGTKKRDSTSRKSTKRPAIVKGDDHSNSKKPLQTHIGEDNNIDPNIHKKNTKTKSKRHIILTNKDEENNNSSSDNKTSCKVSKRGRNTKPVVLQSESSLPMITSKEDGGDGVKNISKKERVSSNKSSSQKIEVTSDTMEVAKRKMEDDSIIFKKIQLHKSIRNCNWRKLSNQLDEIIEININDINISSDNTANSHEFFNIRPILLQLDKEGNTPFHVIIWKAPIHIVQHFLVLLSHENNVAVKQEILLKSNKLGDTPLHLLCRNIFNNNGRTSGCCNSNKAGGKMKEYSQIIQKLLLHAPESLEMKNDNGDTPMHLLIRNFTTYNNTNSDIKTAKPTKTSDPKEAEPTLATDVETNSLNSTKSKDNEGNSTSINDKKEYEAFLVTVSSMLIASCSRSENKLVLKKNLAGLSIFHEAIRCGICDYNLLNLLLTISSSASSVARLTDKKGMLPLHYICKSKYVYYIPIKFIKLLIKAYQSSVYAQDINGNTPLHLLVSNNAIPNINTTTESGLQQLNAIMKIFVILLSPSTTHNISTLLIQNKKEMSPLHCCALRVTKRKVLKYLLQLPEGRDAVLQKSENGSTPLHVACSSQYLSHPSFIYTVEMLCCSSLEAGLIKDINGMTPLLVAVKNPFVTKQVVNKLIAKDPGAIAIPQSSTGYLPLHLAIMSYNNNNRNQNNTKNNSSNKNNTEKGKGGGKLNNRSKCNNGANDREDVIKTLIDYYPLATNVSSSNGNTPLHEACICYNTNNDSSHINASSITTIVEILVGKNRDAINRRNNKGEKPIDLATKYGAPDYVLQILS